MRLPSGDRAVVDIVKLQAYCLDPSHETGKHKARVFRSALGFDQTNATDLRRILLEVAVTGDATAGELDAFGQRYVIDFDLPGRGGAVTARSSWMVRVCEDFPRLMSCYVKQ